MPKDLVTYMIGVRGEDKLRMAIYWQLVDMFHDVNSNEFFPMAQVESWG